MPWQPVGEDLPVCFFRDDGLSDVIGFEYSKWHAEDAVNDFVSRLEALHSDCVNSGQKNPVISIIMDGENAWEYFHQNGRDFLNGLYEALASHPVFNLTTFSDTLEGRQPQALPSLCAGSWVYGNFSTWIGEPAKNRAWYLLCEAAQAVIRSGRAKDPVVQHQLALCEASDWFWWS